MNENLNLVEILKDCPKGTQLYSTAFGDVYFYGISDNEEYPICIAVAGNSDYRTLTYDGKLWRDYGGECILFPSREQRDWSKFNPKKDGLVSTCEFKDGDILSYQCKGFNNRSIYIYRYHKRFNTSYYVALSGDDNEFRIDNTGKWALNGYNDTVRFATEDEKKKLFQAIKDNGYKWNAETKTLEKLVRPKFDPKTLKPFDKILMRDHSTDEWDIGYFSYIKYDLSGFDLSDCEEEGEFLIYTAGGPNYWYAVPYNEDTKHLVGTDSEAPEYYRYWED